MQETKKQSTPLEQLYGHALSVDEIADMKSNLVGFFELLMKIDLRIRQKEKEGVNDGNI
ncbi:MAG: hypothetical protein WC536_01030 [Patescibacteria group bacterium]